jgi:hypothetical protein
MREARDDEAKAWETQCESAWAYASGTGYTPLAKAAQCHTIPLASPIRKIVIRVNQTNMTTGRTIPHPMSISNTARSVIGRTALIALGCAFSLAIVQISTAKAGGAAMLRPLDDQAQSLPVTTSFDKGTDPDLGPYILNIKNTSKDGLKVSVKIHLSVAFHANNKDRNIADHTIDSGQTWTVTDLASGDKITVAAEGFAPLELTVP